MHKLNTELQHPRDQIVEVITRIYRAGLTTTSGGNISIKDAEGNIWITPAAVDKGTLQRKDIVCMDAHGNKKSGFHRPSSEYPFHRAIYEARPDLTAIVHAHPPALVSFATVRMLPSMNIIPQARKVCGEIGYATYACPGSEALGDSISEQFEKGFDSVIMENHGTVVGGRNLNEAFVRFETFEFSARTIINASIIGKPAYLTDEQIEIFESRIPGDLPEMDRVEYPEKERSIRRNIASIVQRSCEQGMMISSYGNISVRWQGDDFLITPRDMARSEMSLEDIVQIRGGKREPGKLPSRAVSVHQKIYQHNPHINSIISTQPSNLMAFGVARKKIDVRTIPESWIFLQDIPTLKFGVQYTEPDKIARSFGRDRPAILIENDGFIVTGDKLLETFDRLEVAEFSARSLVMGHSLGELVPINQEQVDELRRVYFS
jgi:L-fuculose-phosphate aldolase